MAMLTPWTIILIFLLFSCVPLRVFSANCHKDDKKALLKIKAAFGDPADLQWSSDVACCSWYGVTCLTDNGRVRGLEISTPISVVNITGTISPAIGDLPFLSELLIQFAPGLTGSIPPSITKLPLTSLIIRYAGLSGRIPGFLGDLKQLATLDLAANYLTGPIPESVASLPKLNRLILEGNKLTGSIPPSLFLGLTKRDRIDLSNNMLGGDIPKSLGDADLSYVILAGNRFTGDASFLFGESKQTNRIDLSKNMFDFDMSRLSFPQNLLELDLSHNRIYGSIPESLAGLERLYNIDVSYNRLCGKIPTGGAMGTFDASRYAHNKCLCGPPLPDCAALMGTNKIANY